MRARRRRDMHRPQADTPDTEQICWLLNKTEGLNGLSVFYLKDSNQNLLRRRGSLPLKNSHVNTQNRFDVYNVERQTPANTVSTGYEGFVAPGNVILETAFFRRSSMQARAEEMNAVRQRIMGLLRQQMEALDSPSGLTDELLTECYERHAQVQELRERLQALSTLDIETTSAAQPRPTFQDNAAARV
jgi:hypothetical protein